MRAFGHELYLGTNLFDVINKKKLVFRKYWIIQINTDFFSNVKPFVLLIVIANCYFQ